MKNKRAVIICRAISASWLLTCLATVAVAQRIGDPERKNVLVSAANAYYNARHLGLREFSCEAKADWAPIIKTLSANAEGVKSLNAQHYYFKMNVEGEVELVHKSDFRPTKDYEKPLKDLYTAMQEMTTGFFGVWSGFMLRNPFPEPDSKCELLAAANGYEIRCEEPSRTTVTLFKKDFSITEVSVREPNSTSVLRPVFNKTPEGFVITGYDFDLGVTGQSKVKSHVFVVYDTPGGYYLPNKIKFASDNSTQRVQLDLLLSNFHVTKR